MFFGCEDISYFFGDKEVLKNISIDIKKGEFVGLVGDNGSGKSTFMKILSGIYEYKTGKVIFNDEVLNEKTKNKIGYVFQNPENQIVGVTVEEDVAFGMENTGVPRDEMKKKVEWALDIVGLNGKENTDPNTLSGGQKQRLAIASIVAMDPDVIFMDEPTTMLDPIGRREVYGVIKKLVEIGKTVIIASHHYQDLKEVNRIIALSDGKLIFNGDREKLYSKRVSNVEIPFDITIKKEFKMSVQEMIDKLCR